MKVATLIIASIVGIAVLLGGVFYWWPEKIVWLWQDTSQPGRTVTAIYEMGNPSVRIQNAKVVAKEQYSLSFPFAGKIESITGVEGQKMLAADQSLIQMEKTEWELELKKAEASYNEGQAIVKKLKQGARFEELLILEQKKQSSESTLNGSKKEVLDAITNAFVQADDAVHAKTDVIFSNPDSDPNLSFTPTESGLKSRIESEREDIGDVLDKWRNDVDDMKTTGNATRYLEKGRKNISDVREYLDLVGEGVNALTAGAIDQDTIDSWKEALSSARTAVAESAVALGATDAAYQVAAKGVAVAKSELDYRLAGNEKQDIEAALSAAAAAKSQMDIIGEKLRQTTLTTPLPNLLVKKIFPRVGEYVQAGEPVAVLAEPLLEVETDIPEEKIVGIAIGNEVILRLNAYPDRDFSGVITRIDPQEIEKDGGMYFRARATLSEVDGVSLRMGMLGDAVIATTAQGGVVRIPVNATELKDGRRMVRVVENGQEQGRVIETGIEKDGMIEVLSGIQAGDQIIF